MKQAVLIWDLPTRVFHWSLALSFTGAYLTSESERYLNIHVSLGYLMLGLIAFRLIWGFVGSDHARFRDFAYSPNRVSRYLRSLLTDHPEHYTGHNPAGGAAVLLLIGLALLATLSGLATYQEWGNEDIAEELHETASNFMLLIVFVHIAGVIVSSRLHKENLIRSMITGFKNGMPSQAIGSNYTWLAALMVTAMLCFLVYFFSG